MRLLSFLVVLGPLAAAGQPITVLEFSFSNPGARSLGFGGAFVALADDATAAFANPAGLVQLIEPEVSLEVRSWSYETPYTSGGRAAGSPTGRGIDTVAHPLTGESTADLTGLSFVSFVYPRKRWSLAVFRHQLANFEFASERQGIFGPGSGVDGTQRVDIQTGTIDFEIIASGIAGAVRVSDHVSLGLGLSYFDPTMDLVGRDYLPDEDSPESFFEPASFLPDRRTQTISSRIDGGDLGVSAGILWRWSENWRLGTVWRQGPEFDWDLRLETGPANPSLPPGLTFHRTTPLELPDVYGLGLAYRSRDGRWTAAFEWDRVEYSVIVESVDDRLADSGEFIDDADELRLGGEWVMPDSKPVLALRLGIWLDPDHQLASTSADPIHQADFPGGEDELHYTGGLGVAFRRLQIDLGISISDRIDTASLSAIYSF